MKTLANFDSHGLQQSLFGFGGKSIPLHRNRHSQNVAVERTGNPACTTAREPTAALSTIEVAAIDLAGGSFLVSGRLGLVRHFEMHSSNTKQTSLTTETRRHKERAKTLCVSVSLWLKTYLKL